jgi:hypothetical protein
LPSSLYGDSVSLAQPRIQRLSAYVVNDVQSRKEKMRSASGIELYFDEMAVFPDLLGHELGEG